MTHTVSIRPEIIERVIARRGKVHLFDRIDARKAALVVIDMQPTFVAPGAPAEVPAARGIVPAINRLAHAMRKRGGAVIWVMHANDSRNDASDWPGFFDRFVAADLRTRTVEGLSPNAPGQQLWSAMEADPADTRLFKNRYSALISGSSQLERVLRGRGIETLLIAGTKTNVCCESTARDAMMLDFNVVMVSDCLAALSDEEHRATLEVVIQQFGDVMTADEVIARMASNTEQTR
jgi:ureidoacrylate peracid hydrolase